MESNKSIPGRLYPFDAQDLICESNLSLMKKISGIWDRCVAEESDHADRRSVLLEGAGYWIQQSSWIDETGYFIKIRLHPLDRSRKEVHDRGRKVLQEFEGLFPGSRRTYVENGDLLEDGATVTLVVNSDRRSIGD